MSYCRTFIAFIRKVVLVLANSYGRIKSSERRRGWKITSQGGIVIILWWEEKLTAIAVLRILFVKATAISVRFPSLCGRGLLGGRPGEQRAAGVRREQIYKYVRNLKSAAHIERALIGKINKLSQSSRTVLFESSS